MSRPMTSRGRWGGGEPTARLEQLAPTAIPGLLSRPRRRRYLRLEPPAPPRTHPRDRSRARGRSPPGRYGCHRRRCPTTGC
ncbi:hypothetical protein HBB16_12215 [Pseudonocardia sp. MCCB 268]|nr:hypothetical protein [Pseudonocardia cytotoxica]